MPIAADSDELTSTQLALGVGVGLLCVMVCLGGFCWLGEKLLVWKHYGIDVEYTLRGPNGRVIDSPEGKNFRDYPLTLEMEVIPTYGGDRVDGVGGDVFVHPDQACELREPLECQDGVCRAAIRVDGPGLCAFRIRADMRGSGDAGECKNWLFARSADQYEQLRSQWKGKGGDTFVDGRSAEANERCYPPEDETD